MNINHWYTGVVEDVNDPLQVGRVRVRAFNYHSPSQFDIPTQDLPWANVIMPVTSSGVGEIGVAPIGLIPGSWVWGFFRDGDELQDPVVVGVIPSNSVAVGERGNGFADPNGFYPNASGPDIPAGATTYGYGENDPFFNQSSTTAFSNARVGAGTSASTFTGPSVPIKLNSAGLSRLVNVARGEVGVVETSENQGPGIQKYWTATTYPGGYNDRQPWCAAFVSWCVRQSGIFSEEDRPKSAAAFKGGGFEAWAKSKPSVVAFSMGSRSIKAGDLVIFSFSHIGIATSDSDINGNFRTIEGNTNAAGSREGNGVWEKSRNISVVRSSCTIG